MQQLTFLSLLSSENSFFPSNGPKTLLYLSLSALGRTAAGITTGSVPRTAVQLHFLLLRRPSLLFCRTEAAARLWFISVCLFLLRIPYFFPLFQCFSAINLSSSVLLYPLFPSFISIYIDSLCLLQDNQQPRL
ncbi:hypothetical protein S83_064203 [Arachis hypogaea]